MEVILFLVGLGVAIDMAASGEQVDFYEAVESSLFVAEDQTPTGKYTTATEVRMILPHTQAQWIALRPWEGQELLYFTNLLAWRCGLHQVSYAINGGDYQVLEMEPCYVDEAAPNALKMDGGVLPYVTLSADQAQTVDVRILYDDLEEFEAQYDRASIMIQ